MRKTLYPRRWCRWHGRRKERICGSKALMKAQKSGMLLSLNKQSRQAELVKIRKIWPTIACTSRRTNTSSSTLAVHLWKQRLRSKLTDQEQLFRPHVFYNTESAPDWFKILDKPANQVAPETSPTFNGTLTCLSRAQGWVTVTPKNKNRNKPLERAGVVRCV